jgi:hypothetical protein
MSSISVALRPFAALGAALEPVLGRGSNASALQFVRGMATKVETQGAGALIKDGAVAFDTAYTQAVNMVTLGSMSRGAAASAKSLSDAVRGAASHLPDYQTRFPASAFNLERYATAAKKHAPAEWLGVIDRAAGTAEHRILVNRAAVGALAVGAVSVPVGLLVGTAALRN